MREQSSLETATSGSLRFNTDSSKLEIYNGEQWFEIDSTSPDLHTGGTRSVMAISYYAPSYRSDISFFNIDTTGNALDFGNFSDPKGNGSSSAANRTRGIFAGGLTTSPNQSTNRIDFVTIAQTGNATDFGDLTQARRGLSGFSGSHGCIGV